MANTNPKTSSVKLTRSNVKSSYKFDYDKALSIGLIIAIIILVVLTIVYAVMLYNKKTSKSTEQFKENEKSHLEIIYVYSKTCPHCIRFEPVFDQATASFIESVNQYSIEVKKIESNTTDFVYKSHVDGYPTVLVFIDGRFINKSIGYRETNDLKSFFHSLV